MLRAMSEFTLMSRTLPSETQPQGKRATVFGY